MISNKEKSLVSFRGDLILLSFLLGFFNVAIFVWFYTKNVSLQLPTPKKSNPVEVQLYTPPIQEVEFSTPISVNPALASADSADSSSAQNIVTPVASPVKPLAAMLPLPSATTFNSNLSEIASINVERSDPQSNVALLTEYHQGLKNLALANNKNNNGNGNGRGNGIESKGIFGIDELETPLRWKSQEAPVYPSSMIRQKKEVEIEVSYIVEPDGTISGIKFLSDNVPEPFKISIQKALVTWRCEPPLIKGRPARLQLFQKMIFQLKK